jgi:outer membrane murein-binding lipoprotein Lpp
LPLVALPLAVSDLFTVAAVIVAGVILAGNQ